MTDQLPHQYETTGKITYFNFIHKCTCNLKILYS